MKKRYMLWLIGFLIVGCKEKVPDKKVADKKSEFNQELANELKEMAKIDQIAAYIPQGEYKKLSQEAWNAFKDSVFASHQKRIKEIFDQNGVVGFDLAGEKGSSDFWVMVQHSDHDPAFQKEVLEKMKVEVAKGNADSRNYGLLVDRVQLNTGQAQVYGTQVDYNTEICQAFPKNLTDSADVNRRRKEIGLEPLENYLNDMTEMHFEMNKEFYAKKGVKEPKLYKIEE